MTDPLARHSASAAELKERLALERTGQPFLVLRDGGQAQRLVGLGGCDRLVAGRTEDVGLSLPWDEQVSRVHAELELVGGAWTVADDGLSRNGTYVNGQRIRGRRRLADGDVLRLGQTYISYRAPGVSRPDVTALDTATLVPARLTDAQRRVLVALCRPYLQPAGEEAPATNREIADELVLGVDAIKTHMRALFEAFGLQDAPQAIKRVRLVQLAVETGLVSAHDL